MDPMISWREKKATNWIIDNQLARRNLTLEKKTYVLGKKYQIEKKEVGKRGKQKMGQNDLSFNDETITTQKIAVDYKVSEKTPSF